MRRREGVCGCGSTLCFCLLFQTLTKNKLPVRKVPWEPEREKNSILKLYCRVWNFFRRSSRNPNHFEIKCWILDNLKMVSCAFNYILKYKKLVRANKRITECPWNTTSLKHLQSSSIYDTHSKSINLSQGDIDNKDNCYDLMLRNV